jgi:uncharacterized protein YhfF
VPSNVDLYWVQFIESLPATSDRPEACSASGPFGFSPADAREISQLVLAGTKTATGSLLWSYEFDGRQVPRAGDYWIVTDGVDAPVCVVQTIDVRIVPFDEVTPDYAREGGEGDHSLEFWRGIYWRYIVSECSRIHHKPSEKALLVMERFRVVHRERFRPVAR